VADRPLLDSLGEACVALDPAGRVLYANPACAGLLGVAPDDLVGRPLAAALPDFADSPAARACGRALTAGAPQEAQHAFGGRSLHYRAYPAPQGAVVLIADATACRRHEEEQRRRQEETFQAQKLESLGRLAGGLAHDFNNLLVGMLIGADLLRRDLPPGSEQLQLAELIKKAAERASSLSRQMLLYAGKSAPARQPVALADAADECLRLLAADLPDTVTVTRAFAPGLPPAEVDPAQLAQLVTSLVVNAAEALGKNGGRVSLRAGVEEKEEGESVKEEWVLHPSRAVDHVYLEVSDDGCGMSADVLPRIFDPFFTTKGKRRGLGLCSVLGIVRAHGGGLRAGSMPGAGTTVRVLLPVAAAPAAAEPRAEAPPPPPGQVVLHIEEEPVVRGVTSRALARLGLQVLSAAGAREGLELFRRHRDAVNLVLLDLGLPGQDGSQILTALRTERPGLPVVLTSGSGPGPALNQTGPSPAVTVLPKPYTVPALLEVIGRALHGASS
jgi:nitrogen-specific signal transduction histidine kinase/CheY-like chemotaxis protein